MIRLLGADLVGMSTVPEVIVAHQCGLKIMAVSIVSNSTPDDQKSFQKTTMESVIEVIRNSSSRLFDILETMVEEINN
jgi:purine-nucleoside phosphorylase